jgi:hypothetical protein
MKTMTLQNPGIRLDSYILPNTGGHDEVKRAQRWARGHLRVLLQIGAVREGE